MARIHTAALAIVLATFDASGQRLAGPVATGPSPTPESVVMLLDRASEPDGRQRIFDAIGNDDAAVRGAGARIAFVAGLRQAVPALAAALAVENVVDVAVEQTRAIAWFGGSEHDSGLVAAWSRLGADGARQAATALAAARGEAAIPYLGKLREADSSVRAIASFVAAARPGQAVYETLIDRSLQSGDSPLYLGLLEAAQAGAFAVDEPRRLAGLDAARAPEIRRATLEYVLRDWDGDVELPAQLRTALSALAPSAVDTSDVRGRLVDELASRAGGRPASAAFRWDDILRDRDRDVASVLTWDCARRLLSESEWKRAERAFPQLARPSNTAPGGPARRPQAPDSPNEVERPRSGGPMIMQSFDRYPRGFVSAVLKATGCDLGKAPNDNLGGGVLTLRVDGRTSRVAIADTGVRQPGCADAVRRLLMSHVTNRPPTAVDEERFVFVPLDSDYLRCDESQADVTAIPDQHRSGRPIVPPVKTRHRDPVYPRSALNAGIQGTVVMEGVIGTKGCVYDLRVRDGIDRRLDLSALRSVIDWRFRPTLVDGVPVPVVVTVSVQFHR